MNLISPQNILAGSPAPAKSIQNERGQIAIFIALIFNILFVFFAMVINVGMLVHDKINLQNSVDLAAYYAAMKQAEQLNVIAHTNYQIRQSWKLLTWRIRVIGDAQRTGHPMVTPGPYPDEVFNNEANTETANTPVVCIGNYFWADTTDLNKNQNLCKSNTFTIPKIPDIPVIFPGLGLNEGVTNFGKQQAQIFTKSCEQVGEFDWATAAQWLVAYKFDIGNKKSVIRNLAQQLSSSADDFKDVLNESALDGARLTLKNNLTRTNLEGLTEANVSLYNSLGSTPDWTQWLNETFIFPIVPYADVNSGTGQDCKGEARLVNDPKDTLGSGTYSLPHNTEIIESLDPNRELRENVQEPGALSSTNPKSLYHSSSGYEKNPWYLAYVGFKATTQVAKPFAPFGGSVTLSARAFAKPFGGRIGPRMFKNWPMKSLRSTGGGMVDPNLPLGLSDSSVAASVPGQQIFTVPNYSRFPGDKKGLSSLAALGAMIPDITKKLTQHSLTRAFWGKLPEDLAKPTGDPAAFTDPAGISTDPSHKLMLSNADIDQPWIRNFEIAAVIPDLFDITYYSIDPAFFKAYGLRDKPGVIADIGDSNGHQAGGSAPTSTFGIFDQINLAHASAFSTGPWPAYLATDIKALLTGWVTTGAYDYDVSNKPELFQKCTNQENFATQIPGAPGCAEGGRSGYSVKLVSRSYLMDSAILVDDGQGGSGPINNPPPSGW